MANSALANRATLRHLELLVPTRMVFVFDDLDDFGDHVATALHHHPIADLHTQALDLIHVVQRRAAHRGPADRYRLEPGHRREFARPAYLHVDVFHFGYAAA